MPVDRKDLQPGDLLYFGSSDKHITHTGMYIGDGKFINATTHETPMVRIDDLNEAHWTQPAGGHQESEMNRRNFCQDRRRRARCRSRALAAPRRPRRRRSTPKIVRLNLRHTWTTTMSSSQYRDTLHTAYHARRHHRTRRRRAHRALSRGRRRARRRPSESVRDLLLSADPMQFSKIMAEVFQRVHGRVGRQGRRSISR